MNDIGQVVTLGIGEDRFAVPVSRVQEILEARRISRLPNAPAHVLGVIDVRGTGVSVVDLRRLLHLETVSDDESTRILVLWVETEGRRSCIALRADRVFEVTNFDDDRIEPVPDAELLRWDARLVTGIGRHNGDFVTLLDLDKMLETFPAPSSARPGDVAA